MSATTRVVALITGANRGLGFELSRALLRLGGYHVIAAARSWDLQGGAPRDLLRAAYTEATKVPTRHLGGLDFVELDVASSLSRYSLQGALASVLGTEQKLNALINNAGVYPHGWDIKTFRQSLAVNAVGPLRLAEELSPFYAPDMNVINVSSLYGKLEYVSPEYAAALAACKSVDDIEKLAFNPSDLVLSKQTGAADVPAYKVAKAALGRGTQLLAAGAFKGVARANCVEPGWCSTSMGGPTAPRSPAEGARSLFAMLVGDPVVIGTGNFYNYRGKRTSW